jgi:hypothetical protein
MAVAASIVLGTSKGIILVFDYQQNLKSITGPGTKAIEAGAVTALAISSDHTTVAGGHANGDIFTWEIARAAKPFLHIPHLADKQLQNRTADGHVKDVAVVHLGFLGTRHTALVSADERGMAFSHLATRGTGALGRSVKTTRTLGRYPDDAARTGKPRKPSTVLAFAPLPLGNVEGGTDTLGLTAMLTPYLLVIVSTTPVAETQHKAARPKEIAAHGFMTGCLAWFPSVKLKVPDPKTGASVSMAKLVYCWSNVLTVLDVEEHENPDGPEKAPSLNFRARSRWKSEEAIVAVQWLSRSVLAVLTITQRLIVLEDGTMRMTEAFDLLYKHIYHRDLFSKQLHSLVETLNDEGEDADTSMHGVVADAFYMSFKAYKGKMFLLGFNDVSIGAVSNWADRLAALMENGDCVGAIHLVESYYTGSGDKLTIGLPEDTALRQGMVKDKLIEIMDGSLKATFARKLDSEGQRHLQLKELCEACFSAALAAGDVEYLFESVYEWYEENDEIEIFMETLEPYVLEEEITVIPPIVVKSMVSHYVGLGQESRLEELICHMETPTLDIDQITTLCKQHNLYDALIYVWTQALGDYITPLIEILKLATPLVTNGFGHGEAEGDPILGVNALKMFPYLSYTWTGRIYPTGEEMSDEVAQKAKGEIYWFLFSGNAITWPPGSSKSFIPSQSTEEESSFPYLRTILRYDAPSLLSSLNEAFEDSFLNDSPERAETLGNGVELSEERLFGLSINRQYIVSILLEIMNPSDFAQEDTIYLNMFIARNLPKFPQYILLSGSALHRILEGLCAYPGEDLADDAQLSAEYLLSVYHPTDIQSLIPLFREARFWRVLKGIYKADEQYAKLIETYFEDPDEREAVFDAIADVLRPRGAPKKQLNDVYAVIRKYAEELVLLDTARTAQVLQLHAPALHQDVMDAISADSDHEYLYLQTLLEPEKSNVRNVKPSQEKAFIERYVQLMCSFDSGHVAEYVEAVQASDLRLDKVLPAMEESGVVDAAVILMAREGLVKDAMKRLTDHLGKLEAALTGLLMSAEKEDVHNLEPAAEELLEALAKYVGVGVWLCQKSSRSSSIAADKTAVRPLHNRKKSLARKELNAVETLWLDLIESVVGITKKVSASLTTLQDVGTAEIDTKKLLQSTRGLVQRTFTALLAASSTPTPSTSLTPSPPQSAISFLPILRTFLTRASLSSPTIADLRSVLSSVFESYAYEASILGLANRLLEKDLYGNLSQEIKLRGRGWRPRGAGCEGCGRRCWGPGVKGNILEQWGDRLEEEELQRQERRSKRASERGIAPLRDGNEDVKGKGKGRADAANNTIAEEHIDEEVSAVMGGKGQETGSLVVFACRHMYHKRCLEVALQEKASAEEAANYGEGGGGRKERDASRIACPLEK